MREILFRGKTKHGEWEEGWFVVKTRKAPYNPPKEKTAIISKDLYCYDVIPETVGQFTGLYDSTKWENLTEAEKKNFYYKNYSEDGETIKYAKVEDIKHLWKGKPIFEGDIILFEDESPTNYEYHDCTEMRCGEIKFDDGQFYITNRIAVEMSDLIYNGKIEGVLVGNIHDNPDLLER